MGQTYNRRVPKSMMADYDRKLAAMSDKDRNFVKEVMAEQYMEKTATQRGLRMTVTPADKGMRGGPDGDMRSQSGQIVRGEAKGENSKLSPGQRNPIKTLQKDPAQAENRSGQFQKASGLDRQAAQQSRAALERGGSVRYEVSRTQATPNGFQTKVSGRNYALPETGTEGGPVTTTRNPSAIGGGFKPAGESTTALRPGVRHTSGGPNGNNSTPSGPKVSGTPNGPMVTGVPNGPKVVGAPGGPQVMSMPNGPKVAVPNGPRVAGVSNGPKIAATPSGPKVAATPGGPRVAATGPKIASTPSGPKVASTPSGPKIMTSRSGGVGGGM